MIATVQEDMQNEKQKKICFSSVPENLSKVEKLIEDICEDHGIKEDYYGNILISITEAVNNAIQHGNKYNPDKSVEIAFETNREELCFKIADEGEGFDYDNIPDPTDPRNVEKLNGRGIFLMKNLADEVGFTRNGSTVEINFKLSVN